ncbi:hypothetical protein KCP76_22905 [Salmonella enterica subsp. enterica serovar Weltevreden]|nr:hypothetical protein KCP76_22905 [Salmonella enterica subsp. enterica serovar Weltevreden]
MVSCGGYEAPPILLEPRRQPGLALPFLLMQAVKIGNRLPVKTAAGDAGWCISCLPLSC